MAPTSEREEDRISHLPQSSANTSDDDQVRRRRHHEENQLPVPGIPARRQAVVSADAERADGETSTRVLDTQSDPPKIPFILPAQAKILQHLRLATSALHGNGVLQAVAYSEEPPKWLPQEMSEIDLQPVPMLNRKPSQSVQHTDTRRKVQAKSTKQTHANTTLRTRMDHMLPAPKERSKYRLGTLHTEGDHKVATQGKTKQENSGNVQRAKKCSLFPRRTPFFVFS